MRTLTKRLLLAVALLVSANVFAEGIEGKWLVEKKDAMISIYKCADKFCGSIAWLSEPNYPANDEKGMGGKPKVDRENPDAKYRDRPIVGLFMMWGFASADGGKTFDNGTIYSSRNGKYYSGKITVVDGNTITLKGGYSLGFMMVGETQTWTRVP